MFYFLNFFFPFCLTSFTFIPMGCLKLLFKLNSNLIGYNVFLVCGSHFIYFFFILSPGVRNVRNETFRIHSHTADLFYSSEWDCSCGLPMGFLQTPFNKMGQQIPFLSSLLRRKQTLNAPILAYENPTQSYYATYRAYMIS